MYPQTIVKDIYYSSLLICFIRENSEDGSPLDQRKMAKHKFSGLNQLVSAIYEHREHSGSVVECLTQDRMAADLSLTGITALCH